MRRFISQENGPSLYAFTKVRHIVGLDMSLTGTAVCAIPENWKHDLKKVRMFQVGMKLKADATAWEKANRIAQIAHDVTVFCVNCNAKAFSCEDYAYGAKSSSVHQIVELGGVVKNHILETFNKAVIAFPSMSCRKTLLQHVPKMGKGQLKPWVIRNIRRLKGPTRDWTEDQCDAFCVVNHFLMKRGGVALTYEGE